MGGPEVRVSGLELLLEEVTPPIEGVEPPQQIPSEGGAQALPSKRSPMTPFEQMVRNESQRRNRNKPGTAAFAKRAMVNQAFRE